MAHPGGALEVVALCDDTALDDRFLAEHGLSLLVSLANGRRWLVDVGTTDVFLANAARLGVSLDGLAGIALSHGHDDHTGGLTFYPRLGGAPPIHGHPYLWHKTYQVKAGEPVRVCGMPYLARRHAQPHFHAVNGVAQLDDDLFLFTDVARAPGSHAPIQGNFFNEDGTGPVPLLDDATVVARTPGGLVVLFGCAHAGYANIVRAIRARFPGEPLRSVVGGLHLVTASEAVLEEAVACTAETRSDDFTFYGGHCTGEGALRWFRARLGDGVVRPLGSGRTIRY